MLKSHHKTFDSMETMKGWFVNKCKDVNNALLSLDKEAIGRKLGAIVVTPSNIPEFTIPRGTSTDSQGRQHSKGE